MNDNRYCFLKLLLSLLCHPKGHPLHYLITNNVNDLNLNLNTPVLNNTNVEIP